MRDAAGEAAAQGEANLEPLTRGRQTLRFGVCKLAHALDDIPKPASVLSFSFTSGAFVLGPFVSGIGHGCAIGFTLLPILQAHELG